MNILLNGEPASVGTPGSYVTLTRRWADGDTAEFDVPMALTRCLYQGVEEIKGYDRYGYTYARC